MKYIPVFIIIIISYFLISNVIVANDVIPEEALRIRIIANSNDEYDQKIKYQVKDKIEFKMYNYLKDVKGVDNARKIINNNLSDISNDVNTVLKENNYELGYKINFGYNYFPEKKYKGIKYEEGYYESLVVTLGKGEGDNWWCVLFPPLCLIEAESNDDIEYTTLVGEMMDKYL